LITEIIRQAIAKIHREKVIIRDHNDLDRVLASLDARIELLSMDERRDLVSKTVEACERAGIKIPNTDG
jgi:hypothetical protein